MMEMANDQLWEMERELKSERLKNAKAIKVVLRRLISWLIRA